MSRLIVNQIQGDTVTKNTEVPSGHTFNVIGELQKSGVSIGGIVQVKRDIDQTRSSMTGTSGGFTNTGVSVDITPKSTSSKMLIFARMFGEGPSDSHNISMAIFRDSTNINAGDAGLAGQRVMVTAGSDYYNNDTDSTPQTWSTTTLDEPNTTSQITYSIRFANQGSTSTFYLNGTVNATTSTDSYERGSSEIIVVEVLV